MKDVLRRLVAGEITEDEALAEIRALQMHELAGRATLDLGRHLRRGLPEVVLAAGKAPDDAARLAVALALRQGQGLISRMSGAHREALDMAASVAHATVISYHSSARVLREGWAAEPVGGKVGILTAGTSDVPAADEARMVVEACGLEARLSADLGVAGLHRFVAPLAQLLEWGADAMVVAAGMDGVLPGLISGLISVPVIGLPVSTGYGRGGSGEGALTTMLQSCATGLVVVNIDNGVGAGAAAALIATQAAQGRLRGLNDAMTAPMSATAMSTPINSGAKERHASGPPGMAKVRARMTTETKTPATNHGKPRRRRP
ncbi:MAG TPA: nickel pincer cofactor biosynthesis protein LarB [Patescibacteria group bacterium]|nr:nickel pincer cofactor biosynthesis protein LarB [Patescibacteria group bacterium]